MHAKERGKKMEVDRRMQAEAQRAEAERMGLKAGRSVTITYKALDKTGAYIVRKVVRGVVIELYKHFFSVKIGKRVICYRYNEFLGNENVKVKLKA